MINQVSKHEVFSTMIILSIVSVQVERKSGYGYLKEIVVRRADQKLYKFKEGDFSDLHLNDIEDMLLLIAQNNLFNLEEDVILDFVTALKKCSHEESLFKTGLKMSRDSEVRAKGSKIKEESSSKRAGDKLEQESSKKQKMEDDKEIAELQSIMEVIPDEKEVAVDAIPLATKPPSIVDWKIIKEGKIGYYQIIRADGNSKRYSSMI
ncbi:hypothetical protein Tco_1301719 [Tanacetum coccineum]